MKYWTGIATLVKEVQNNQLPLVAGLGLGVFFSVFGQVLNDVYARSEFFPEGFSAAIFVTAGELIGCLVFFFLYRMFVTSAFAKPYILVTSFMLFLIGNCIILGVSADNLRVVFIVGCVIATAARSQIELLWVDLCSSMEPRQVIITFSAAYLTRLFIYPFYCALPREYLIAASILLIFLALICISFSFASSSLDTYPNNMPQVRPVHHDFLFWGISFALAYGVVSGITKMGNTGVFMCVGWALPAIIVLASLAIRPAESQALRLCHTIALPCATVGVLAAVFLTGMLELSQVLMGASLMSVYMLTFSMTCANARLNHTSAVCDYAILMAAIILFVQVGKFLSSTVLQSHQGIFIVTVILLITASDLIIMRERSFMGHLDNSSKKEDQPNPLQEAAQKYGLTGREAEVFFLLADGLSTNDIASRLYITKGAARSHISRVYSKVGVHDREALKEFILGL
ncbi:MAG: hypothetical protein IKE43_06365 [Coriobacteriales bacterium]|nr:hypothetical protein [Coriobacteriales bacterium]